MVMAADRPYGEFYDLYSVSPEYFEYHLLFGGGRRSFFHGKSCCGTKLTAYRHLGPRLSRDGAKALLPVPKYGYMTHTTTILNLMPKLHNRVA
jgi:hypothetical protein